jgi:hypothetical protein
VALCDRCSDHFLLLDCLTPDLDVLKAEAESRLDEVERLLQAVGGWRKRSGKCKTSRTIEGTASG